MRERHADPYYLPERAGNSPQKVATDLSTRQ
jgi:hypothetical protein